MTMRRLGAASAALVLTLGLAACGSDDGGGDGGSGGDGGDSIKIGIKFDQPGLGLKEGNTYTGFDVDVANYVAKEMGKTDVQFVQAPSKQREDLIATGQVDLIFATYSITDARKERISFAGPYFIAGQDLLVRTGSTISGPDDVDGKILCSVEGSTSAQKIRDDYSSGSLQLFPVRTYSQCVEFLAAGTVDAVTTDNIILAGFAAQDAYKGKVKVVGNTFSEEDYGVGLPKGDRGRCRAVNAAITDLIADGTWRRLLAKNVGSSFTPDEKLNPPKVDDSLCE